MLKKVLISASFFLAAACGKQAHAQEILFAPNDFLACGDPSKGTYKCNSNSIEYIYDTPSLPNNGWYNNNAINSESPAIYGPYLNLLGSFSNVVVSATVAVPQLLYVAASTINECNDIAGRHEHLFDVVLVGNCAGNPETVLQRLSAQIQHSGWDSVRSVCATATNFYPQTSIGLAYNSQYNYCTNFQIEARQVNPKLMQPPKPGYYPVAFTGFTPINISVTGN